MLRLISTAINTELSSGRSYDEIYRRWLSCVVYCAMNRSKGNITETARLLKVHRNTLERWLKEMRESGLKTSEYEAPKGQGWNHPG